MKVDTVLTTLTYTTGFYQDINVRNLAGVDVYGVVGVVIQGSRSSIGYGIVNGSAGNYTISVTAYEKTTGAPMPSVTYDIDIYYLRRR